MSNDFGFIKKLLIVSHFIILTFIHIRAIIIVSIYSTTFTGLIFLIKNNSIIILALFSNNKFYNFFKKAWTCSSTNEYSYSSTTSAVWTSSTVPLTQYGTSSIISTSLMLVIQVTVTSHTCTCRNKSSNLSFLLIQEMNLSYRGSLRL